MKKFCLQLALTGALTITGACVAISQSNNYRLTFGMGVRPIRVASTEIPLILYDHYGLSDTLEAHVTSRDRPTDLGYYIGLEQNPKNGIFTQFQIDFNFGKHGNHYIAGVVGLGHTFSAGRRLRLSPCVNLWGGYLGNELTTINAENLYIRAGDEVLDRFETITLKKTATLFGGSPNLILGIQLGENAQVRVTAGYLASIQTNQKLVLSGENEAGTSVSAKISLDDPGAVLVGPTDSVSRLKSMLRMQGFYFTIGLLL